MKNKIAIAVHGGAGSTPVFVNLYKKGIESGLIDAMEAGYKLLNKGESALDAVEAAVNALENNPLFNAGRGSALNANGEVEMDASIMEGKHKNAGAVAIVKNIKNPISFARMIMEKTNHVLVGGIHAKEIAQELHIEMKEDSYFITERRYNDYETKKKKYHDEKQLYQKVKGTVGAVAVDSDGNLAAGTSSGGTTFCVPGRIGDSCLLGAGCYADNNSCAVSGTGDGEYFMRHSIAHSICSMMEYTKAELQVCCDYILLDKLKDEDAQMGVISVDKNGNFGITFNTDVMLRGWRSSEDMQVRMFKT